MQTKITINYLVQNMIIVTTPEVSGEAIEEVKAKFTAALLKALEAGNELIQKE